MGQKVTRTPRECAVCGGKEKRRLFEQTFSTVCLLEGYTVVVCEHCGFAFADDIPAQEAFDAYYRDLSKYEYQHRGGRESTNDETRQRDVAATLAGLIPHKQTRILEIGCSTGRLLALLKENGYQNVWGLDPSPVCAASARDLYGVTVFTQSVSDLAKSQEKFDFLILVGVLEHIRDLEALCAPCTGYLRRTRVSISTCRMPRSSRTFRTRPTSSSAWNISTFFRAYRWPI
jgi:SAM-dependent methyltransferase